MRRAIGVVSALAAAIVIFFLLRSGPGGSGKPEPRTPDTPVPTSTRAGSASSPDSRTRSSTMAAARPAPSSTAGKGQTIVAAPWGSRPGEVGRREDPESASEGPMSILTDGGDVVILDQVNGRVQRFRGGAAVSSTEIGDTVHDLALGPRGELITLDRLVDKQLEIYGPDGKLKNAVPIEGKGLDDAGLATGVFAGEDGIYVEREHGSLVRVADAEGNPDGERPELPGRPIGDGGLVANAGIVDAGQGIVVVTAFDRATLEVRWSRTVELGASILQLLMLDSDRAGNVFLAAAIADEGPPPDFALQDAMIRVLRFNAAGEPTGSVDLPALDSGDDVQRPLTVDDDGAILLMKSGASGVEVVRYTL